MAATEIDALRFDIRLNFVDKTQGNIRRLLGAVLIVIAFR
uniref:Uncharacterized protein n=1 Tax=Ralstonia solanacearum TaxID=305 RepID=A0A0S4UEZ5_RALSL|nr:protein of unknown function [Ralstonia solanacearum]CUV29576.1 protein of unknown function [Ralstonia solanacearum]CUV57381.1 protein of unknown function [Ralstonia solanacearum]